MRLAVVYLEGNSHEKTFTCDIGFGSFIVCGRSDSSICLNAVGISVLQGGEDVKNQNSKFVSPPGMPWWVFLCRKE
jgi:hypothetical protein